MARVPAVETVRTAAGRAARRHPELSGSTCLCLTHRPATDAVRYLQDRSTAYVPRRRLRSWIIYITALLPSLCGLPNYVAYFVSDPVFPLNAHGGSDIVRRCFGRHKAEGRTEMTRADGPEPYESRIYWPSLLSGRWASVEEALEKRTNLCRLHTHRLQR